MPPNEINEEIEWDLKERRAKKILPGDVKNSAEQNKIIQTFCNFLLGEKVPGRHKSS